jgi:hypothetical protein
MEHEHSVRTVAVADSVEMEHVLRSAFDELALQSGEMQLEIYAAALRKDWFLTAGDLRAAVSDAGVWTAIALPLRLKIALKNILMAGAAEEAPKQAGIQQQQACMSSNINREKVTPYDEDEAKEELEVDETDTHLWKREYCERTGYPYFYHVETGESYWDSKDTTPHPDFVVNAHAPSNLTAPSSGTWEVPHVHSTEERKKNKEEEEEEDTPLQLAPTNGAVCASDSEFARMLQAQFDREDNAMHGSSNSRVRHSSGSIAYLAKESRQPALPSTDPPAAALASAPASALASAPASALASASASVPASSQRGGALARALDHGLNYTHPRDGTNASIAAGQADYLQNFLYLEEKADIPNVTMGNRSEDTTTPPLPSAPPSVPGLPTGNRNGVVTASESLAPPVRLLNMPVPWLNIDIINVASPGTTAAIPSAERRADVLPTTDINNRTGRATEVDAFAELRGTSHPDAKPRGKPAGSKSRGSKPGGIPTCKPSGTLGQQNDLGLANAQTNSTGITSVSSPSTQRTKTAAVSSVPTLPTRRPQPNVVAMPHTPHAAPVSPVKEATPVGFMSGMLWKKSRKHVLIGSKWQRRWFELRHDALVYFQDATSASPKNSSPSPKASKFKLKAGMLVKLWWPDDSLWVNARVLQCKGRDSFDMVVLKDKVSSVIGISNKWVKGVQRKRIRTVAPHDMGSHHAMDASESGSAGTADRLNAGHNSEPLAMVPRYLGMIDSATSKASDAHHLEAHVLAGDDRNFPPQRPGPLGSPSLSHRQLQPPRRHLLPGSTGSGSKIPGKILRGKGSLLKRIPLSHISALLRDPSSAGKREFGIALISGRILELRASSSEIAGNWTRQLDALITSLPAQNDAVPLAPLGSEVLGGSPGHSAGESEVAGRGRKKQIESDTDYAAKLQEQFDREARGAAAAESTSLTPPSAANSLLRRLAKGGATPPSTHF